MGRRGSGPSLPSCPPRSVASLHGVRRCTSCSIRTLRRGSDRNADPAPEGGLAAGGSTKLSHPLAIIERMFAFALLTGLVVGLVAGAVAATLAMRARAAASMASTAAEAGGAAALARRAVEERDAALQQADAARQAASALSAELARREAELAHERRGAGQQLGRRGEGQHKSVRAL